MASMQIFDNFFKEALTPLRESFPRVFFDSNQYSIYEKEGKYFVELAVPGLRPEDISVNVDKEKKLLKVEAKKAEEESQQEEGKITWYHKGVQNRSFSLLLPNDLKLDTVKAECVDGKLTVSFEMKNKEEIESETLLQVPILGNKA